MTNRKQFLLLIMNSANDKRRWASELRSVFLSLSATQGGAELLTANIHVSLLCYLCVIDLLDLLSASLCFPAVCVAPPT